jgi:hypothetical protein
MAKILRMLFTLLITLMPMASVSAQAEEVFCGTLSAADCDILQANHLADAGLTSMTYELQMTMSVLQASAAEPESFAISSAGTVSYDKADLDAMTDEILNTTIGEVLELLDNPDTLVDRIVGYLERLATAPTAEVAVEVVLPEGIEEDIQSLSVDFKMTDGVIYVTSPLLETTDLPPDTWVSLDLVEVVNMLVELLQNPAFVEGMTSGMGGVTTFPAPTTPEGSPAADMQALFARIAEIANAPYWEEMDSPEFMAQVEAITRLADTEVDGIPVAVFEGRVDMAAMAASESFQQAFSDLFDLFAEDISPEEREALKPIILDMLAGMEITSIQAIGLEDHFTYSVDVSWAMTVDPQAFVTAVVPEDERGDIPEDALAVQTQTFEFHQEIRDHNQPVVVTPPPAENVISLLAMLMAGPPPS